MRNATKKEHKDTRVIIIVAMDIVVVETTIKRYEKWIGKIGVDKTTVVEKVVVQIVQMSKVTIVKNIDTMQRISMLRRNRKKMKF